LNEGWCDDGENYGVSNGMYDWRPWVESGYEGEVDGLDWVDGVGEGEV
jgi:hypothetical protein